MRKPSPAAVLASVALFVALGGVGIAADGQNLILGKPDNSATHKTGLSTPVNDKALQLTNTNTGTSATALGLTVASGHAPFTVSSPTRVVNLNADLLDGMNSGGFVPASALRRVGPVTVTGSLDGTEPTLVTIGQLTFSGLCVDTGTVQEGRLHITSSVAHAAYADVTLSGGLGVFDDADMLAGLRYILTGTGAISADVHAFAPVTGEALSADGHQVSYNLYMGVNARGQSGKCVFGGSFVVK
jgi:hypothetical protein